MVKIKIKKPLSEKGEKHFKPYCMGSPYGRGFVYSLHHINWWHLLSALQLNTLTLETLTLKMTLYFHHGI
jgi:hypothetical protein